MIVKFNIVAFQCNFKTNIKLTYVCQDTLEMHVITFKYVTPQVKSAGPLKIGPKFREANHPLKKTIIQKPKSSVHSLQAVWISALLNDCFRPLFSALLYRFSSERVRVNVCVLTVSRLLFPSLPC